MYTHSLQKFKLNIANTVISQENSSLLSMNTSDLLELFQLSDATEGDRLTAKVGGEFVRGIIHKSSMSYIHRVCIQVRDYRSLQSFIHKNTQSTSSCDYITLVLHYRVVYLLIMYLYGGASLYCRVLVAVKHQEEVVCAACWRTFQSYGAKNSTQMNMIFLLL